LNWRGVGHYLIYCVISRSDGTAIGVDDPNATRIVTDLIDTYLAAEILSARATQSR
jgi:hypothetical protein